MTERYLKPKEVAALLGVSLQTARSRMADMPGCIDVGRGGNQSLRVPESGLEAWKANKVVCVQKASWRIARRPIGRQRGA